MQSIQISTLITDWSFKYCGASACLSKSSWLLFTHYIADWVTLVTIISSWADRNDITLCHIKPTVYRADVHRHKLTKTSNTANVWLFCFCFCFFPHGALLSCQYVPVASGQCRLFSFVWLSGRVSTTGSSSHLQSYRSPNGFLSSSFWPRCLGDYQLLGVLVVFKSAKMCFSPASGCAGWCLVWRNWWRWEAGVALDR